MEELKAEALLSPAPSIAAASPMAFQAFQSRLQRAGYDLTCGPPDQARAAVSSADSFLPKPAAGELEAQVAAQEMPQQQGNLQASSAEDSEEPADTNSPHEQEATSSMMEEFKGKSSPDDNSTARVITESRTAPNGPASRPDQGSEGSATETDGQAVVPIHSQAMDRAQSSESCLSISEHAASLSTVLSGVPIPAIECILGDATSAAATNTSEPLMSAGAGDSSAKASLDALVDQIIDRKMREERESQGPSLKWPGLSEEDLLEPEAVLVTADNRSGLLAPAILPVADELAVNRIGGDYLHAPEVLILTGEQAGGASEEDGVLEPEIVKSADEQTRSACLENGLLEPEMLVLTDEHAPGSPQEDGLPEADILTETDILTVSDSPVVEACQEDDSAPRPVDARCAARHAAPSVHESARTAAEQLPSVHSVGAAKDTLQRGDTSQVMLMQISVLLESCWACHWV